MESEIICCNDNLTWMWIENCIISSSRGGDSGGALSRVLVGFFLEGGLYLVNDDGDEENENVDAKSKIVHQIVSVESVIIIESRPVSVCLCAYELGK